MDTAQVVGAVINRDRFQIATEVIDELMRAQPAAVTMYGLTREALLEYALHDLSKLFVAVISHRPELFGKYVEWQRSMFTHRNIPSLAILVQLQVTESVLARRLDEDQTTVIRGIFDEARRTLEGIMAPEEPYVARQAPHGELAVRYLQLLVERRAEEAIRAVESAVDEGLSVSAAYLDVIQPVQREIGRLWQVNELSVTGEHYATDATRTLMARLRTRFSPVARRDTAVVTACLGGELHDVGARMVSDFLHLAGFRSIFVGANTPHTTIIDELARVDAGVLALSATMTLQVRTAYELIDRVRSTFSDRVRVVVGGYAFDRAGSLWRDIGADGYADRADQAVEQVELLAP